MREPRLNKAQNETPSHNSSLLTNYNTASYCTNTNRSYLASKLLDDCFTWSIATCKITTPFRASIFTLNMQTLTYSCTLNEKRKQGNWDEHENMLAMYSTILFRTPNKSLPSTLTFATSKEASALQIFEDISVTIQKRNQPEV